MDGTLTLTDIQVLSNSANNFGGGIVAFNAVTITGSYIENNQSLNDTGGGVYAASTLTLADTHVLSNTANEAGGGLYANNAATITGSYIETIRVQAMRAAVSMPLQR